MRFGLFLVPILLGACAEEASLGPEPIRATISDIRKSPERYDNRRVVVRGWLKKCEGYDCWLVESASSNPLEDESQYLSIGYDPQFDAKVAQYLPAEFELEATVSAECLRLYCTDRADDLHAVKVLNVLSADTKPSQEHQ